MGLVAVAVVSRTASSDRISDGWWQNMVGSVICTLARDYGRRSFLVYCCVWLHFNSVIRVECRWTMDEDNRPVLATTRQDPSSRVFWNIRFYYDVIHRKLSSLTLSNNLSRCTQLHHPCALVDRIPVSTKRERESTGAFRSIIIYGVQHSLYGVVVVEVVTTVVVGDCRVNDYH